MSRSTFRVHFENDHDEEKQIVDVLKGMAPITRQRVIRGVIVDAFRKGLLDVDEMAFFLADSKGYSRVVSVESLGVVGDSVTDYREDVKSTKEPVDNELAAASLKGDVEDRKGSGDKLEAVSEKPANKAQSPALPPSSVKVDGEAHKKPNNALSAILGAHLKR